MSPALALGFFTPGAPGKHFPCVSFLNIFVWLRGAFIAAHGVNLCCSMPSLSCSMWDLVVQRGRKPSPCVESSEVLSYWTTGKSQFQRILSCTTVTPHLVSHIFFITPNRADNHHSATSRLCRLIQPGHLTKTASNHTQPLVSQHSMVGRHH